MQNVRKWAVVSVATAAMFAAMPAWANPLQGQAQAQGQQQATSVAVGG